MPEVTTTKPFAFREGGESRIVEAGEQCLSQACAEHAQRIGAVAEPASAVVEPQAKPEVEAPAEAGQAERKRTK
ncbi:hypothetical protein ACA097_09535 [Pseudomonas sp. QL9]|uniref:hypothetical protein n=1 Tax=Pseudomonas sp. QL9 TaxID=3242725 RepID=UPI00352B3DC7